MSDSDDAAAKSSGSCFRRRRKRISAAPDRSDMASKTNGTEGTNGHHGSPLDGILEQYGMSNDKLRTVMQLLLRAMRDGLSAESNAAATVKMFPTYVRHLPDGQETGRFLALDLGGTNFRVLAIELQKHRKVAIESKTYVVPQQLMVGTGEALFDHIASCLASFVEEFNVVSKGGQSLPLGFTFSFPCKQEGLTKATLVSWTKGFKCSGVEGQDVVRLLRDAVQRRDDICIDVVGIVNDTTGTLMACAHRNKNCCVGLIIGTGTNACYVEKIENVGTWDGPTDEPRHVIINTEWGAFGSDGALDFLRTSHDKQLDADSINPGLQIYEKMISGMYMGELVRLILRDLAKEQKIFKGLDGSILQEKDIFNTKYLSEIEKGSSSDLAGTRMVLGEIGLVGATEEDCRSVRTVCNAVSNRAAHLAAAGTATLINRIGKKHIIVGVDGSVYRFHPRFHTCMVDKINELLNPGLKFDLMLSEDGSGRGAALVAAVAAKAHKP